LSAVIGFASSICFSEGGGWFGLKGHLMQWQAAEDYPHS